MIKYKIERTSRFKKDYKLIQKRGYDIKLIEDIIRKLAKGEKLEAKHRDHALKGNFTGTHSDLLEQ